MLQIYKHIDIWYKNLYSHIFYDIICKSQTLGMTNNWDVPHPSPDSTGGLEGGGISPVVDFEGFVLKTTKLFWWIWVFPNIGGTPKWMIYNGKPY